MCCGAKCPQTGAAREDPRFSASPAASFSSLKKCEGDRGPAGTSRIAQKFAQSGPKPGEQRPPDHTLGHPVKIKNALVSVMPAGQQHRHQTPRPNHTGEQPSTAHCRPAALIGPRFVGQQPPLTRAKLTACDCLSFVHPRNQPPTPVSDHHVIPLFSAPG